MGHLYSRDTAIQGTQNLVLEKCSGGSRVGAWGATPPPPPYFWTKLRPEELKNIFLETGPSPLSKGLDDHSPRPLSQGLRPPLKCSHNLCINFVASIEGTLLFRAMGHFFWVLKPGFNPLRDTLVFISHNGSSFQT